MMVRCERGVRRELLFGQGRGKRMFFKKNKMRKEEAEARGGCGEWAPLAACVEMRAAAHHAVSRRWGGG